MELNYQDIRLSRKHKKVLKKALKGPFTATSQEWRDTLRWLVECHLISRNHGFALIDVDEQTHQKTIYRITEIGRMWLRHHQNDFWNEFRAWITLFIAAIGLIFSAISLAIDAYQLWIQ